MGEVATVPYPDSVANLGTVLSVAYEGLAPEAKVAALEDPDEE